MHANSDPFTARIEVRGIFLTPPNVWDEGGTTSYGLGRPPD